MKATYEETVLYVCSEKDCPGSISLSKSLPSPEGAECMACHKGYYIKYEKSKYIGWNWQEIDGGFVAGNYTCVGIIDKNL